MDQYDWLSYSLKLKGALCKNCVLFRPNICHGSMLGAFIVSPFKKFRDFHIHAKAHAKSKWHSSALIKSTNFLKVMSDKQNDVLSSVDSFAKEPIKQNRLKLEPIVKTIVFCGTHDLPLRGKRGDSGNFITDLLNFRVHSGDIILKNHLDNSGGKSKYIYLTEYKMSW